MPVERSEVVTPKRLRMFCDCGEEMEFTGRTLMTFPPQYVHKCKSCGEEARLASQYPYISFESKEGQGDA